MIPLHSAATAVYAQVSTHASARTLPPADWEATIAEGHASTLRRYGPMFSAWLWPFLFSDASAPMDALPDDKAVAWVLSQAPPEVWASVKAWCGRRDVEGAS